MADCENCGKDHGDMAIDVNNLSHEEQKVVKLMTSMFMEHHDKLENLNNRLKAFSSVMMIQQVTIQSLFLAVAELKGVPPEEIAAMEESFKTTMDDMMNADLEEDKNPLSEQYQATADEIAKKLLDF